MHFVIVGSSAAGTAAARSIRKFGSSDQITIITKDNEFFSRCQLHLLASGRRTHEQANFLPEGWIENADVRILWDTEVTKIAPTEHTIYAEGGLELNYDSLLIATGSRSWCPPIEGIEGEFTFGLRNISDADKIFSVLPFIQSVTIIGAGLVGCELAAELSAIGKTVNVVELAPYPLPMQLEESTGKRCSELMQKSGINMYCGKKASKIKRSADGIPKAVILDNGESIETDLIVTAAGVRPNIEWLEGCEILTDQKGILINEYCQTSIPDVFAAGDVTVMKDILLRSVMPSPIWPTAIHQGRIAGINMTGGHESLTRNTGFRSSVRLLGNNIVSLGPVSRPDPAWEKQEIKYTNSRGQTCVKILYFDDEHLRAAILWGDITDAGVYTDAIINNRDLPERRELVTNLDGAKFGKEVRNIL